METPYDLTNKALVDSTINVAVVARTALPENFGDKQWEFIHWYGALLARLDRVEPPFNQGDVVQDAESNTEGEKRMFIVGRIDYRDGRWYFHPKGDGQTYPANAFKQVSPAEIQPA